MKKRKNRTSRISANIPPHQPPFPSLPWSDAAMLPLSEVVFSAPAYFLSSVLLTYYVHRYNATAVATAVVNSPWASTRGSASRDTAGLHANALISLVLQIFNHHGLLEYLSVADFYAQLKTLASPSCRSGPTYRANPYHNFQHACHVVLNAHRLFTSLRADLEINTPDADKLAFFIGALFHDLDHDGRSNRQHKEAGALAKSPLETNSVALATALCFPRFLRLPVGSQTRFAALFASLVLRTDLSDVEGTNQLKATTTKQKQGGSVPKQGDDTYLHWALRLADIGCVMQDYETYCRWAYLLHEEQVLAGSTQSLEDFAVKNLEFLKTHVREEVNFTSDLFETTNNPSENMSLCLEANIYRLESKSVEERVEDMRKYGNAKRR